MSSRLKGMAPLNQRKDKEKLTNFGFYLSDKLRKKF